MRKSLLWFGILVLGMGWIGSVARAVDLDFSGVSFLNYSHNNSASSFDIGRMYLTAKAKISDNLTFQYTTDLRRVSGAAPASINGSLLAFAKFAFLQVNDLKEYVPLLAGNKLGIGLHPLLWIPTEEKVWRYRYVQRGLLDEEGLIPSADFGVRLDGKAGGVDYAVSVHNGTGFSAPESDQFRDVEALISTKPRPDVQLSLGTKFSGSSTLTRSMGLASFSPEPARIAGVYSTGYTGAANYSAFAIIGGYKILANYDLFGRYSSYDPDVSVASNRLNRYTLGVSKDLAKGVQMAIDVQALRNESGAGDMTVGRVDLSVNF